MAKKIKCTTGDVFAIPVSDTEFIFGKVTFDVTTQYIKVVSKEEWGAKYLDFFNGCVLVETYLGVYTSVEEVDFGKKAVNGIFVINGFLSEHKGMIVGKREVNPVDVSFPETLASRNMSFYLTLGELALPIQITSQIYHDEIGIMPSTGYGYDIVMATLDYSGREDLIEEGEKMDNYFKFEDLRSVPDARKRMWELAGEDMNKSYYELAKEKGLDLARLYVPTVEKKKTRTPKEKCPKEILTEVRWAFYGGRFDTIGEFLKAVQEYHEEIDADEWQPEEVVLGCKEVTVQYAYWDEEDEEIEDDFRLTADGDHFSAGELLFKIHNQVVECLEEEDQHFFEGLSLYKNATSKDAPFYILELGS